MHGDGDGRSGLCDEFEAVRERRQVADEVGDDVAVHQAWSCGIGAGNIGAGKGGVGGYQSSQAGRRVKFGREVGRVGKRGESGVTGRNRGGGEGLGEGKVTVARESSH